MNTSQSNTLSSMPLLPWHARKDDSDTVKPEYASLLDGVDSDSSFSVKPEHPLPGSAVFGGHVSGIAPIRMGDKGDIVGGWENLRQCKDQVAV
ncbi:hypothetical protein DL546_000250 [Coniochaeta pulveracea]|uniref:Uncharacterized protein n=1 Tax=Coniochaeta pulveracea TaxID=177199 RepID=A0A420XWH7_9PEZI|nr:hypothetical protein DL546_000250 [Coniochaeta pulveracea]